MDGKRDLHAAQTTTGGFSRMYTCLAGSGLSPRTEKVRVSRASPERSGEVEGACRMGDAKKCVGEFRGPGRLDATGNEVISPSCVPPSVRSSKLVISRFSGFQRQHEKPGFSRTNCIRSGDERRPCRQIGEGELGLDATVRHPRRGSASRESDTATAPVQLLPVAPFRGGGCHLDRDNRAERDGPDEASEQR